MKIQEDLVYDKTGCHLLGFVNLGDVNEQLQEFERLAGSDKLVDQIGTHMLTLMVRGIFTKLEFPYANFPTTGTCFNQMFSYFGVKQGAFYL